MKQKLTAEQRDWLIERFKKVIDFDLRLMSVEGKFSFNDVENILHHCTQQEFPGWQKNDVSITLDTVKYNHICFRFDRDEYCFPFQAFAKIADGVAAIKAWIEQNEK